MILLLLLGGAISTAGLTTEACPTCLLVNTTCYNTTHLLDLDAPFRTEVVIHKLGLLRSKNILYFTFEPTLDDIEYYKAGFVNLDNPSETAIIRSNQILNFGTFDIDQDNNMIYFGGSDGIFVLDTNANTMSLYSSLGDRITNVFYKNNVYFTKYEDKGIVVKLGDYFKTLVEYVAVKKFVINKNGVLVYMNNTGLFVSKGSAAKQISDNAFFRGITIDLDDNVYAWWLDGIYKVVIEKELDRSRIDKVADLEGIGGMVFDNDNNILIVHDKGLYRLSVTVGGCDTIMETAYSFDVNN